MKLALPSKWYSSGLGLIDPQHGPPELGAGNSALQLDSVTLSIRILEKES